MKLDIDWAAMAKAVAKACPGQGSGDLWSKGQVTFSPRVR